MIIDGYRQAGDLPAPPIIELLLSDAALIERGRAELDAHAQAMDQLDLAIVYRPGLRLGQLVETSTPIRPDTLRGKITGIAIHVRVGEADTSLECTLNLEAPRP